MTAKRTARFGSIQATLNHVQMVDRFCLNAVLGRSLDRALLDEANFCPGLPILTTRQAASAADLPVHVEGLPPETLVQIVPFDWRAGSA